VQTTQDGTFTGANHTFCAWVGYSPEELSGKLKFQDLLNMGGRIFHQTHWLPLLQMQGSIAEVKVEIIHRDGSAIPMVINALRRVEQGAVVHQLAAFVARDRDKYERELVLSRKRFEELFREATRLQDEAKDRALFAEQMIGIVSHDLRNPLASIAMGTALLMRGELDEGKQRVVTQISRSKDRATRLIGDLLDFTQARLGKGITVTARRLELHTIVAESVDELALAYSGRLLKHEQNGDGTASVDSHRLAQLIGNLVSNAMTYGGADKLVTVTSTVDEETFSVAVHNHGKPIPPALQGKIFEPMTRGGQSSGTSRSVGLGLYIVRQIAKAHRGEVGVTSNEADGTTFTATFPRATPPPPPPSAPTRP